MTLPSAESRDFDRDYGGVESVRDARADVRSWMDHRHTDVESSRRAVLIVSELASNALQASPNAQYHVHLGVVDHCTLDVAVRNVRSSATAPAPSLSRLVKPQAIRGRGLSIVELLSQHVAVQVTDQEVCVSATISSHSDA